MNRLLNYVHNPEIIARVLLQRLGYFLPDKLFLNLQYRLHMGKSLRIAPPTTLSEKLNWLKLYYHNPKLHQLVDKYEVGRYVEEKIGKEYVIPCIGLWDKVDDIDFDKLPNQFVLKCTHDSGSVVICRDKTQFNIEGARRKLLKGLKRDYYKGKREWAYKGLKPRIIAEPFIPTLMRPDSVEYKLTVYNGKVSFVTVCTGIAHSSLDARTNDHFTTDWKRLPFYAYYKPSNQDIKKPVYMDEMISLTEKLAESLPQVRVDWYYTDNKILFGEMTFYTWAGYLKFVPEEWDEKLGSMLELPKEKWI